MTITRLTSLPDTITAGDTVAVTLAVPDYPAPTYALRWAIAGTSAEEHWSTDNADGVSHDFDLISELAAGTYRWSLRASGASVIATLATGTLTVLADVGELTTDTEIAYCERMLGLVRTARENILSGEVKMMMIDGRQTMFLTLAEVAKEEAHWQARIARLENGGQRPPVIVGRFRRNTGGWE